MDESTRQHVAAVATARTGRRCITCRKRIHKNQGTWIHNETGTHIIEIDGEAHSAFPNWL